MFWLGLIGFALLPIQPAIFAILAALAGILALVGRRVKIEFFWSLVIFALLGTTAQLVSPKPQALPTVLPWSQNLDQLPINLIPNNGIADLHGWNHQDGPGPFAQYLEDGFWRLTRVNPITQRPYIEILSDRTYPLVEGQVYTQSFYFRHDGQAIAFDFIFSTLRGQVRVPATIVELSGGLKRAYASYQAQPIDQSLRAIDIGTFQGDWTYIEIGFAQLESNPAPSPYVYTSRAQSQEWLWWVGTALMIFFVLHGSVYGFSVYDAKPLGRPIVLGLIIYASYILYEVGTSEGSRITGFAENANLLGHQALMMAGLAWLLGGANIGSIAILVGSLIIWFSGSRAGLLGVLPFLLLSWNSLNQRWRMGLLMAIVATAIFLYFQPGRLTTLAEPDSIYNKSRPQVWGVAIQAFLERPLTGWGLGGFAPYYLEHRPPHPFDPAAGHAHNLILQLLAESGLLGLAAFLVLWGSVVRKLWRLRAWKSLVLIVVALLINMVDYTWFYAGVHYPLWIAVAWAIHRSNQAQADRMAR